MAEEKTHDGHGIPEDVLKKALEDADNYGAQKELKDK